MTSATAIATPGRTLEVVPLPGALGTEIRGCDVRALDDEGFDTVRKALADNLLLLFRGQQLDEAEQTAFNKEFGIPARAPMMTKGVRARDQRFPYVSLISNVQENGVPIGALGDGEAFWHTDTSYEERPPSYSTFFAMEVPPQQGDTSFTNMYAALETLPTDIYRAIKGRELKHDSTYNAGGELHAGAQHTTDVVNCPGAVHPIIRTHPTTGYNTLYLGRRSNAYIVGLPVDESEELLNFLWRHAVRPEFVWTHHWTVGDLLVWDNQCLMHRRDAFDGQYRRVMRKAYCVGSKPYCADAAFRLPDHPRAAALVARMRASA
jgi:taurine dioxygenase